MSAWLWMATSLALGVTLQDPNDPPTTPQEPGAGEASETTAAAGSPAPTGPPAFDHEFGLDEILASLARLVREYPELARLETLGRSRSGHELQMVTLTDPSVGVPAEKPGLLFVDFSGPVQPGHPGGRSTTRSTRGAESVLAFGWSLAGRAGREPAIASLLAEHVVYLMPACDPDLRLVEDRTRSSPVEFDLNFPLGWQPDSLRPGSGAFPLARPETMALARFLHEHPNLVLIVSVGLPSTPGEAPWKGAEFPGADREALDALCLPFSTRSDVVLRPWGRLGSPGGGLFDYAYQAQGIYPVSWVGVEGTEVDTARVDAIAAETIALLGSMPRMRLAPAAMREVAPGLWEVDVAISNAGVLPTLSALAAERRLAGALYLDVEGTKLVATARKSDADAAFHAARLHPRSEAVDLLGSTLRGGETRWLRLILEGEAGTVVELQGVGACAGSMRLELELR